MPTSDWTNAWIELTTPLRVRNVPSSDSENAIDTSTMFQTLSIPFFSCTITECRNAVAASHGMSAAFSTGSQAQYPPHPISTYAQWAPSSIPVPSAAQLTSVQRRTETSQRASVRPVMSAAIANANGIDIV